MSAHKKAKGGDQPKDDLKEALIRAFEASETTREPEPEEQGGGVQLELPYFDDAHVLPNSLLRSAMFPAIDSKKERPYLEKHPIFSVGSLEIVFTGRQFDQWDLDVLAAVIDFGTRTATPLGEVFQFSGYALLKHMGKVPGGRQYEALLASLLRLNQGQILIKAGTRRFFGSLVEGGIGDDATQVYQVRLNGSLGALFGLHMWSRVDRDQRRALGKNGTAKALHGYYSSHADPLPHRYPTLAQIAGLHAKRSHTVKRSLIKAHEALQKVGFLDSFNPGPTTIEIIKCHETPSQQRHRARKKVRALRLPASRQDSSLHPSK